MFRFPRWKILSIIGMTLIAFLLIVPSLMPEASFKSLKASLPRWLPVEQVILGLDLQGGAHILLEVDQADVVKTQVNNLRDDVRRVMREENIRLSGGIGVPAGQPRTVQVRVPEAADRAKVMPKLRQLGQSQVSALGTVGAPPMEFQEAPDGLIRITITDQGLLERTRKAVGQAIEVIRRRVDQLGTVEPNIQQQGSDRVLVQVPGLQDTSRLKGLLGSTAKLEFRLVAEPGYNPGDVDLLKEFDKQGREVAQYPVEKQVMVLGEDLTDAQPGFDQRTSEPIVNFKFNIRGGQRFGEVTSANVGRPFAIVLDDKVISAPRILGPITGGSGQISGRFTVEQANDLAILMRAGALPAKMNIVEERTVGPGLGQDSIDAGKKAAYIAGVLVVVYMLMTYGVFGIFANIALIIHIAMIFASLILLHATLTLPGIAGIVLTIGMAVDSNVLIYERIREEAKMGRSLISALDAGFNRAFATIVDSQSTMMVAAVILYFLGSGPVRGFAVSLGLGILTTIITAVTMTKMMIALWYRFGKPKALPI